MPGSIEPLIYTKFYLLPFKFFILHCTQIAPMHIVQQVLFALVAIAAIFLFTKKIKELRRNILLGRDADYSDHKDLRWKNVLLLAFGQKKMFKKPLVALMHFVIYAGFIIINIEVLEILLDGLFGTHRLFAAPLGALYGVL